MSHLLWLSVSLRVFIKLQWPHLNQIKLLAKYSNCIVLPQVIVNHTALCGAVCGFMVKKLHKIAPLRTYIYNINNLILHEVVNPTLVHSIFTLKTSSFLLYTKSKFQTSLTSPSHTLTLFSLYSLTLCKHN